MLSIILRACLVAVAVVLAAPVVNAQAGNDDVAHCITLAWDYDNYDRSAECELSYSEIPGRYPFTLTNSCNFPVGVEWMTNEGGRDWERVVTQLRDRGALYGDSEIEAGGIVRSAVVCTTDRPIVRWCTYHANDQILSRSHQCNRWTPEP